MRNYTIEVLEPDYELLSQEATTSDSSLENMDVNKILAKFFAYRAINEANKIWDERGYTEGTMEAWLNEE